MTAADDKDRTALRTQMKSGELSPPSQPKEFQVNKESKVKKIFVRVVFGGLMIIWFNFLMWAGHLYVGFFVIFIQSLIFGELVSVRYQSYSHLRATQSLLAIPFFRTLQWCWFGSAAFYIYGDWLHEFCREHRSMHIFLPLMTYQKLVSLWAYVSTFVLTVLTMKPGCYRFQMGQLSWTVWSIVLILGQMRFVHHNIANGLFWFFFPVSVVITNDIFAYFCGLLFGKKIINRPFLSLSPNKTWEGYIGSLFFTLLFGYQMSAFVARWSWFTCPADRLEFYLHPPLSCATDPTFELETYTWPPPFVQEIFPDFPQFLTIEKFQILPIQIHGLALAFFASVVGPFGGFLASAIKRAYEIKDFNSIIPGHGGMTDRMDCQLQMALFTFVYHSTFVKSVGPATKILASAMLLPYEDAEKLHHDLGLHLESLLNETSPEAFH